MAINAGYSNNVNRVTIRGFGNVTQSLTDRNVDIDGDGIKEQDAIIHISGHGAVGGGKVKYAFSEPIGSSRSVIKSTVEVDGGISEKIRVSTEEC